MDMKRAGDVAGAGHRVSQHGRRYYSLDAMRGLAALLVATYHFREAYAPSAHLAVDFFFVLSGFVITEAYRQKLLEGMKTWSFMNARLARLYPLFLVGIVVGLLQIIILTAMGERTQSWPDLVLSLIANLLVLPSPSYFFANHPMQGLFPINGPAWSMFWELLVNLLFAAALFRLSARAIGVVILLAGVILAFDCFHYGSLNIGWEWPSVFGGLPRVVFSFSIGIILSRVVGRRPALREGWIAVFPVAILLCCLLIPVHGSYRVVYDLLFCVIVSPVIVASGAMLEVGPRMISFASWLGYVSYPLYIVHRGVIGLYKPISESSGFVGILSLIACLTIAVAFAFAMSRTVDRLSRRKKA